VGRRRRPGTGAPTVERFYRWGRALPPAPPRCSHPPAPLKGAPATALGVDDAGYLRCPDPGQPYTRGGTVVFELREEKTGKSSGTG